MDLFETKAIKPMLIGSEGEPFDDPNYIFELKLDGERAIAYLDKTDTELRNKRNKKMLPVFPELKDIHKQVKKQCILDGEYIVFKEGKPDFSEVQRRSLMSNPFKIELAAQKFPVSFVAFDILYLDGKQTTSLPLMERKKLLQKTVKENERLSISRYIEEQGAALYALAEKQELEGIVAKKKDSIYKLDTRTKDWIKIKYMQDDDFVVCGWINKSNHMSSIVLGQYKDGNMIYKGHVTLGVSGSEFQKIRELRKLYSPPFPVPAGNEDAVWVPPKLVCTVKFMHKTASGGMRQPVFKGLRQDKLPTECVDVDL